VVKLTVLTGTSLAVVRWLATLGYGGLVAAA
jgi:hypothetical protein